MGRVGILTGGGDCPGLNAAIRAVVRTATKKNWEVIGFLQGWKGILKNQTKAIGLEGIDDLLSRGGTILGTSRTNPYKEKNGTDAIRESMKANRLDGLIVIGGEDTLGVAAKLFKEGIKVVGAAKTIDNDLNATDFTIGFETALEIVTEAIDRIRTTAESHERVMIVEIMGRHAGWLATCGGLAGGADAILVPEFPMSLKELCATVESCKKRGKKYAIVAVAEGAKLIGENGKEIESASAEAVDSFGHVQLGGIGELVAKMIKKQTGYDTRSTNLGHIQRGGSPTAFDRILATAYGMRAMELVLKGEFGKMPVFTGGKLTTAPLDSAVAELKTVPSHIYDMAKGLFG